MAVWADIVEKKNQLIRKALDAEVFLAPTTAAVPETIVNAGGTEPALPTGFLPLGHHTDDGVRWGREVENSDVTSHGSVDPTRTDIRRINRTVAVTAQETNLQTLEASLGLDLSDIAPPASGEVVFEEPNRPVAVYYRLLGLAVDDSDFGEIYIGRLYSRAKVSEVGEEVWNNEDQALQRELTFQAFHDSEAGFAVRHFFGGPGWTGLLEDMGFPAASA